MRLRRARGAPRGRIEIIPMIDVMFFLLVTFMLASLSMQHLHALAVALPRDTPRHLAGSGEDSGMTVRDIWRDAKVRPFLLYGFVVSSAQAANTYTLGFLVIDRLAV